MASRGFPLSVCKARYTLFAHCNCSWGTGDVPTFSNVTLCFFCGVHGYSSIYDIGTVFDVRWRYLPNTSCWYSYKLANLWFILPLNWDIFFSSLSHQYVILNSVNVWSNKNSFILNTALYRSNFRFNKHEA